MSDTMGLTQLPPHDDNCGQPGQSCPGCSAMPASPVVVRLDDSVDWEQVASWCGGELHTSSSVPGMDPESCIELRTAQGREETAGEGDWLIRGPHGEFWVVESVVAGILRNQWDKDRRQAARARRDARAGIERIDCTWCGKRDRRKSEWEQLGSGQVYKPLCEPCADKRLNNPYNALLPMRKIGAAA